MPRYFPNVLKTFRSVWKLDKFSEILSLSFLSRHILGTFKKTLEYLENLRIVCKLSSFSVSFFCCQETFQAVWHPTISRFTGNFQDIWKTFMSVWKPAKCSDFFVYIFLSGHILGCFDFFQIFCKFSGLSVSFPGCFPSCLEAFQSVLTPAKISENFKNVK